MTKRPQKRLSVGRSASMQSRRFGCEPLEPRLVLTGGLCITEFMASNSGTLVDSFGDSSDWIELYNASSSTVDLSQYYLTDDALDLDKFALPAINLSPKGTLVVHASGRDVVAANGEIHTNFSLSATGDYLALVDVNEVVVQDFGASYPQQIEDISYGLEMLTSGNPTALLASGAAAKLLIPTQNIGTGWVDPGFSDSSWSNATLPIGYENGTGYEGLINTNVPNTTTSAYVRIPFTLTSLDSTAGLTLGARYDDGFVAYLNGVEIVRAGAPDSLSWNSAATDNHDDVLAVNYQTFDISSGQPLLQLGQNVLAVQALNLAGGSSDFLFEPIIEGRQAGIVQPIETGFFATATPGGANGDAVDGFVEEVLFSLSHGFYNQSQSLSLLTPTAGATIVYTTDGSVPTVNTNGANLTPSNGSVYNGPITINQTTVVRAAAFAVNQSPSIARAQSYLFTGDIINQSPNNQTPAGWPANGSSTLNGQYMDYGMDPDILAQYGTAAVENALKSISTLSINTNLENLFDQQDGLYSNASNRGRVTEKFISLELIEPDGSPGFQVNGGLRIRGGYSRNDWFAKHNLRVFFRGEYGDSKLDYPVFGNEGAPDYDVIDLRSAQNFSWGEGGNQRMTFLREIFGRDTQADMGNTHTRSRYHHLYMNGIYWGVYQTQERVEAYFGESYLGGDEDDYDRAKGDNSNGLQVHFPDGNEQAWTDTFNLAQSLATNPTANADNYWTLQGKNPDGTRNPSLPVLLDMDNLIDYMMILFYTGGTDTGFSIWTNPSNSLANNWVALRNRVTNDQGWQFFVHDNEHSFAINRGYSANGITQPTHQDRTGPFNNGFQDSLSHSSPPFLHQDLLVHEEYRLKWQDRVQKHFFNDGVLTLPNVLERWNERQATVDDVIIAHAARWGDRYDEDFSGDAPRNKQTWLNEVNWIKNSYLPQRNSIVLNQLVGDDLHATISPANFNQWGGVVNNGFGVTLSNNGGGTIYYTTDGTDPRKAGGAINATASSYSSSIPVNGNLNVKARVRLNNGDWSALTESTFQLPAVAANASNLRVTEINFHPSDPTAAELAAVPSATAGSFEFLEFANTSGSDINLTGVQITTPINFTFPAMNLAAGDRVLVVRDEAAFAARYSPLIATAGSYGDGNGLSDGGDPITVIAANGGAVQTFAYDDSGDWPSLADGEGHSLQVIDVAGDYNDPLNWLPSRDEQGSPGLADLPTNSTSGLRITEINYNPALGVGAEFVEIKNDSGSPINLNGVEFVEGITFDFSTSSISVLQPGEYALVVGDVAVFNAAYGSGLPVAGAYTGALSNGGERVTLFDPNSRSIHDFVYDDISPWDTAADGGGSSLEVISTSGNYGSASNWGSSVVTGGTPGSDGSSLPCDYVGGSNGCDIADIDALYAGTHGAPGPLTDALITQWLTDSSDVANPAKADSGHVYVMGDIDLDGDVDSTDLGLLLNNFSDVSGLDWGGGNLNSDASVDSTDLGLLLNNFSFSSVVVAASSVSVASPHAVVVESQERDPLQALPVNENSQTSSADFGGYQSALQAPVLVSEPASDGLLVADDGFSVRDLVFGALGFEDDDDN